MSTVDVHSLNWPNQAEWYNTIFKEFYMIQGGRVYVWKHDNVWHPHTARTVEEVYNKEYILRAPDRSYARQEANNTLIQAVLDAVHGNTKGAGALSARFHEVARAVRAYEVKVAKQNNQFAYNEGEKVILKASHHLNKAKPVVVKFRHRFGGICLSSGDTILRGQKVYIVEYSKSKSKSGVKGYTVGEDALELP